MKKYAFYGRGFDPSYKSTCMFTKHLQAKSDDDACLKIFNQMNAGLVRDVFVILPFLDVSVFPDNALCKKYWKRFWEPQPWTDEPIWDDDSYDREDWEAIQQLKVEYVRKILRGEVSGMKAVDRNNFSWIRLEEIQEDKRRAVYCEDIFFSGDDVLLQK